jgi:hypothetical protein
MLLLLLGVHCVVVTQCSLCCCYCFVLIMLLLLIDVHHVVVIALHSSCCFVVSHSLRCCAWCSLCWCYLKFIVLLLLAIQASFFPSSFFWCLVLNVFMLSLLTFIVLLMLNVHHVVTIA